MKHKILKVFFWYLSADFQFFKHPSRKALNLSPNGNFSILSLFCQPFCYHSNGNSLINARILHLGYLAVVRPTRVYLLDFYCSAFQFYLLLSPYLCFISFSYLDLYVLGDDASIS